MRQTSVNERTSLANDGIEVDTLNFNTTVPQPLRHKHKFDFGDCVVRAWKSLTVVISNVAVFREAVADDATALNDSAIDIAAAFGARINPSFLASRAVALM